MPQKYVNKRALEALGGSPEFFQPGI